MIKIIAVGKIKEKYIEDAISEYLKRLSKFTKTEIIEVKDIPAKENASESEKAEVKEKEGKEILSKINSEYVIALDQKGEMLDSLSFSEKISNIFLNYNSTIAFVIGGSLGLSADVLKRADYTMSFSKLTFPHQLFRVNLLEAIYRSFKIINNEPYNK